MDARILAGVVAGALVGAVVFGAFIGLGLLLLNRVASGLPVVILAIAGAYAGWLVGVIVFSRVRGGDGQEQRS